MLRKLKSVRPKEAGQAAVEFALALIVFVPLLFIIIDIGWITYQKVAFEYGYMHSSWTISAKAIGDNDPMDSDPSAVVLAIDGPLKTEIINNSAGLIEANLEVYNATAVLHNEKQDYVAPPSKAGYSSVSVSRTRYMEIKAELKYVIYPITAIGKALLQESFTITKDLEKTRVVKTQHRTE